MRLAERIGRGGMGEVWRGTHLDLDLPIALKVLRTPDPRHRAAFLNEIRAISTLSHPHIIDIVEQGQLSPDDTAELPAGSPYLAMELAQGTIAPSCGQMSWDGIRATLLSLLSALGHAHARGLLHGDLKPGNVLLVGPIIKLSDFGLARRLGRPPEATVSMGTPRYMAPEQALSRWREAGPWTDLFALGRLTEAMLYGKPGSSSPHPTLPLPEGFLSWLARLLAPDPADRFQRAADAAYSLAMLPEPPEALPGDRGAAQLDHTLTFPDVVSSIIEDTWHSEVLVGPPPDALPSTIVLADRPRPPLPEDWRAPTLRPGPRRQGLSLLGLRSSPTIGREAEQEVLWSALRAVSEGELRVCIIGGEAGTGKRRLAHWLSERAHEVGAVTVLAARHTERSSDALGRMLAHTFHCIGLSRDEVARLVEAQLRLDGVDDPYEWQGLTELIVPSGMVRFSAQGARFALLQRHLERTARTQQRPVLLRLEDAQWGGEALAFAMHLLRARHRPPVLVLITWAPVPDRPLETSRLKALLRQPRVQQLLVEPLRPGEQRRLVSEAQGLSPALAARAAALSGGRPMFATHLVKHWAETGSLHLTPDGIEARPDPDRPLAAPESLDALWLARLDHCISQLPPGVSAEQRLAAVELASLLDGPVDHSEWRRACGGAGLVAESELVEALLASGLARCPTSDLEAGWTLTHWTLREAIEQRAASSGRMPSLHRACAWLLAERPEPTMALRLARHLLDAGEDEAALEPLYIAARQLALQGAYRQGTVLLATRDRAIDRLGLAADAPARLQGLLLSAHYAQSTRDLTRAEALIGQALVSSRPLDRVRALQQLSRLRRDQGQLSEARGLAQQALRMAEDLDNPLLLAHCHRDRASVLLLEGDFERAERAYLLALDCDEQAGDEKGAALTLKGLGRLYTRTRRWPEAVAHISRSRELYRKLRERLGESACLNALGEVARKQGQLDKAERCYLAALDGLRDTGQIGESIAAINLALVRLEQGRLEEAEEVLASEQRRHEQSGQHGTAGLLYAYRLPGLVGLGRWTQAETTLLQAQQSAERSNLHDPDAAHFAAMAAEQARTSGRGALAAQLSALAEWHQP
ncbi:MAG: serine/threonine protein kinase/tetratricopeptide (TPR) repeat protein [Myxococcota bacterium]|jgi:serine/threonine protein kinase/tetratricopeptide (TPR) repeat protein